MLTLGSIAKRRSKLREMGERAWSVHEDAAKPAYVPLGIHITLIPDPLYPFPEWLLNAVRELDPGFFPVFRRMFYRTPAGTTLGFEHFGVGRYDRFRQPLLSIVQAPTATTGPMSELPYGMHPNIIERWFQNPSHRIPGSIRAKNNLPPPFIPANEWILRWVEETYWAATAKDLAQYAAEHDPSIETAKNREFEASEAEYRQKNEAPLQKMLWESLNPNDVREQLARQSGQVERERKPLVFTPRKGVA